MSGNNAGWGLLWLRGGVSGLVSGRGCVIGNSADSCNGGHYLRPPSRKLFVSGRVCPLWVLDHIRKGTCRVCAHDAPVVNRYSMMKRALTMRWIAVVFGVSLLGL
ncbi:hypothetical protein F5B17DRAFT_383751 [Nemania serpens]|nr:hypothetical protein F5B17DRAFT_383751 [Nemania serpens]